MIGFEEYLKSRLASGGFTTEDALVCFLPLVRQVVQTHSRGLVAPLEGLNHLRIESEQIFYEELHQLPIRNNHARIRQFERTDATAMEVISEARVETDQVEDRPKIKDLRIGARGEEIVRPVYLPGYVTWEHEIEHHDPLTDTFSLGLILASLSCGLDLSEDDDLLSFVQNRHNLFALNPKLHPVLARAITRMTELDRHRRPQDLQTLLKALENYRDQDVDIDIQLAQVPGFASTDPKGKQQIVLTKLQERLFEITRRNRLLHFRATMNSVNLTHASVPLSFNIQSIRPDQILVWNDSFQQQVATGKPVSLNRYLNFQEAIYLPSVLDRIRIDAQRDKNEYGFAQLRLVACFLRWSNVKENPPTEFDSPLVLIPVELTVKKGVRDSFQLRALETQAEINPVVRHLFKQLYNIDLPEYIDLEKASLDDLHAYLVRQIEASEPAVSLVKIERPRIEVIHDKAKRRLEQYRRRARLSGRGVRRFMDLDYSYDRSNYHPLGLKLFNEHIRPAPTRLETIVGGKPRRNYNVAPANPETADENQPSLYVLRDGDRSNPYVWEFDLCSVTLGNFKYRKMSLVRDYQSLLGNGFENPAFEATFSLKPRPIQTPSAEMLPLEERFHVIACDPTQSAAIAQSRTGSSYIIQGPPGTGKSQTITNLIADYVARGKRILFVCEKRAAIDVVYHRLRQRGLDQLCCLIHDSQSDKKAFIADLKQTYETFLKTPATALQNAESKRTELLRELQSALAPIEHFHQTMNSEPATAGIRVKQLLDKLLELKHLLPENGNCKAPTFALYQQCQQALEDFQQKFVELDPEGILAQHPLRMLSPAVAESSQPVDFVHHSLIRVTEPLEQLLESLKQAKLADICESTSFENCLQLFEYAAKARFLVDCNQLALLDEESPELKEFKTAERKILRQQKVLHEKREATAGWRNKLPANELEIALEQARAFENDSWRYFKPSWWKLRSILNRGYNFDRHQIRPSWVQVLLWLQDEYKQEASLQELDAQFAKRFGLSVSFQEFTNQLVAFNEYISALPAEIRDVHEILLSSPDRVQKLSALGHAAAVANRAKEQLDRFLSNYGALTLRQLTEMLGEIDDSIDELPDFLECMRELGQLPDPVAGALRNNAWTVKQLEAASAQRSFEDITNEDAEFAKFNGRSLIQNLQKLSKLVDDAYHANAEVICQRVQSRFREHVDLSTSLAAGLSAEVKEFRRCYSKGRRELEHEFGKTMRYKPIRELVTAESGIVVKDLKPIWLMSPLSVSDTLPLDTEHFDVVIFDEASQILLEEAIPSLFRATQTIVVGDEMQLPPTNFFSARRPEDEGPLEIEEDGEVVEYDLESNSFLNHAARNLPSRMLGWHYRSRSESLISFSNWAFYSGRLLTVPEDALNTNGRQELIAHSADDADVHASEVLARPVSFHLLEHGVYEKRRNRAEAEYIARLVRSLLKAPSRPTLGIVAFSEAQQDEIESALSELAEMDRSFGDALEAEYEREEDGQFAGLLVKNLENIQGDERDVIILSVCYAPDSHGKMRMNFGPINQSGGEKRLNVAFSRAKHHMVLVSSIRSTAITNEYNDGANSLKNYLLYAEKSSLGETAAAQQVLQSMAAARNIEVPQEQSRDTVVEQLAEELQTLGFLVDRAVGQSKFRCDLSLRREGDSHYRLAVLVDTAEYYQQSDLLERDLMKPNLLRAFGWKVATVLAKDWWEDREAVLQRIQRLADEGVDEWLLPEPSTSAVKSRRTKPNNLKASKAAESSTSQPQADYSCYLEQQDSRQKKKAGKFWEIQVHGTTQTIRFGQIGQRGDTRVKTFDDADAAKADAERQVQKKIEKGFRVAEG